MSEYVDAARIYCIAGVPNRSAPADLRVKMQESRRAVFAAGDLILDDTLRLAYMHFVQTLDLEAGKAYETADAAAATMATAMADGTDIIGMLAERIRALMPAESPSVPKPRP